MRKVILLCVLMMIFLPLGACSAGGESQKALDEALTIRGEYLSLTSFSTQAQLRADYGQRVYDYTLDVSAAEEETVLTVAAPELIAGITARLKPDESLLIYDDVCIETGPLNNEGLTPISAIPAMLDAARQDYITACCYEQPDLLRVEYGSPDAPPGSGTQFILWFRTDTHDLAQGEVAVDGARRITCTFSPFTKE